MEVAMPMAGSAMDSYEDMFKEITRKLYGEDGLPDLTADRLASTSQDRLVSLDYDVEGPMLKPEEHLTAFGLAALMQNGFSPSGILNTTFTTLKPQSTLTAANAEDKWVQGEEVLQWTQSKIATYNPSQKLFRCSECDCVGYLLRVAEHWLGTHSNIRAFHCPQCTYESAWARCVRVHLIRQHNIDVDESCEDLTKDNPILLEVIKYLQRLKNKVDGSCGNKSEEFQGLPSTSTSTIQNSLDQSSSSLQTDQTNSASATKRYSCTYCPYATDRRDLFTRHENIHREEKPFQCYVCQKQFNRADHVKKHFLRMHRDHPYDLNRIRRHPPKNASGMSYYQKYNAAVAGTTPNLQQETLSTLTTIGSLSIPGFNNIARNQTVVSGIRQTEIKSLNGKTNAVTKSGSKKKSEKRFTCCYCSWSGVDNWCLKRHMNTHLKPFICVLCDYKAARSERLATHVLKVHNKRSCSKCNFLAEDLAQLTAHQQEQHPNEHRSRTSSTATSHSTATQTSTNNILRTNAFTNTTTPSATVTSSNTTNNTAIQPIIQSTTQSGSQMITFCSEPLSSIKTTDLTAAAAQLLQHNRFLQADVKTWKSQLSKPHGAARLFNYMEASDESDQDGNDSPPRTTDGDLLTRVTLSQRIQSDFLEAGGVDNQPEADEEIPGEETELPLFVCPTCGCEFEDDLSLETHQLTHRHVATSPASKTNEEAKENVDPGAKYLCKLCDAHFDTQNKILAHLIVHTSLAAKPVVLPTPSCKSKRKQHKPKKVVVPYWDSDEVEVLRHLSSKLRKWRDFLTSENSGGLSKLVDKYMARLVTRRGMVCRICKSSGIVRYHTKASLTLHYYQKHSKVKYRCEHCDMTFKHKYQTILHSSRVHTEPQKPPTTTTNLTVMMPATITREPPSAHISLENVPSADLSSFANFFTTSHNIAVPDANISNVHKLGMSFFDHTFMHSNTTNTHMPIIIPSFQPT